MENMMLIRSPALVLISVGFLGILGCSKVGDPQVELSNKMMTAMDEIGDVFSSIKDEKSAEAAKVKLESLVTGMNSLVEQGKKLGDPSPELKQKLEAQIKEKATAMQAKIMEFAKNAMANPKIMEIIGPVMQKMSAGN
jgi:lysyl-tRNA synthetase class II